MNHVLDERGHLCHLANMNEWLVCGSDAALCQIAGTLVITSSDSWYWCCCCLCACPSVLVIPVSPAGLAEAVEMLFRMKTCVTHTHPFNGPFPGLPRWAGTRKVKPIWILMKQEAVSGSGISWAICKSAPRSRQITTPAAHHSVFYRPDAFPAAQPTASKHWKHLSK